MKYTEIIDQYLNDEMTPQEATAFRKRVKIDPDLEYEVRLYQLTMAGIEYSEDTDTQELKNELKAIGAKIRQEEEKETPIVEMKPKRSNNTRRLLALAASLLLMLAAYFLLENLQAKSSISPMAEISQESVKSGLSGARSGNIPTTLTLYQQGLKLFKEEEYESAIKLFEQVTDVNQRDVAKFLKADALYRLGKKDKAREALESIEKGFPKYDEVQDILEKLKN